MATTKKKSDTNQALGKLLDSKFKPLHGELAKLTRELRDVKFEQIKTTTAAMRIDKEITRIDSNVDSLKETVYALVADMNELQDTTKAIWDKISLESDKTKREINEIREHIGLAS